MKGSMMTTKYRTIFGKISKEEIIRETPKMVVFLNRAGREIKEAKRTEFQNWFDSWADAKQFLVAERETAVMDAEKALIKARQELMEMQGLREATA